MKVLTAEQMRWVDRRTCEERGFESAVLMENAAARVVEFIQARLGDPQGRSIAVVCGKGNNGGDGAAAARMLCERGAIVHVLLSSPMETTRGDARLNFERLKSVGKNGESLHLYAAGEPSAWGGFQTALDGSWLNIDALLGTGLQRPAEGLYADVITAVNGARMRHGVPTLAVDIPSGLDADSEHVPGAAITADWTVTFTAPKPALALPPACDYAGEIQTVDIGSPDSIIEQSGSKLQITDSGQVEAWLRSTRRSPAGHKGTYGHALVFAGSAGKAGASILCGFAALRAGAGLVTVATPASISNLPVVRHPELMTEGLRETSSGSVAVAARAQLDRLIESRDIAALGPGLGTAPSTRRVVFDTVRTRKRRMILDADALNNLAPWPSELDDPGRPLILTPHPGEMGRLTGLTTSEILARRLEIARSFAVEHHLYLVLKGQRTLIADPAGQVHVNPTGNAGMATAGSGDVLTGMLAGSLAPRASDLDIGLPCIVYLHGLAGEIASHRQGLRGLTASDIIESLPDAIRQVCPGGGEF